MDDYRFVLVSTDHKVGSGAIIELPRTGQSVAKAVIYAIPIDMPHDGMVTTTSWVSAMPTGAPGSYRFATCITMAAKNQVERETAKAAIEWRAAQ